MSYYAKIFANGRSQAVRLPKALRFEGDTVIAKRFGRGVVLLPLDNTYALMEEALEEFEEDINMERRQMEEQSRPPLFSS